MLLSMFVLSCSPPLMFLSWLTPFGSLSRARYFLPLLLSLTLLLFFFSSSAFLSLDFRRANIVNYFRCCVWTTCPEPLFSSSKSFWWYNASAGNNVNSSACSDAYVFRYCSFGSPLSLLKVFFRFCFVCCYFRFLFLVWSRIFSAYSHPSMLTRAKPDPIRRILSR